MAASMTAMEMLVQEIEQLQNKKTSLQATVKAAESKIKDLREQVVLKEYECRQIIVTTQEKCDAERATLAQLVAPLRGEVDRLKGQVQTEAGRLKVLEEKHTALSQQQQVIRTDIEKQVAKRQTILQDIETRIGALKAHVGAL